MTLYSFVQNAFNGDKYIITESGKSEQPIFCGFLYEPDCHSKLQIYLDREVDRMRMSGTYHVIELVN